MRNKCKKRHLNREELKQLFFFYISARRWQEGEEKSRKISFCSHLTEDPLRLCFSFPSTVFERIRCVLPTVSVNSVFQRGGNSIWKDGAQTVGRERGNGVQGSKRYRSAMEQLWERFGLYGQTLDKLLTLLTSKTLVYFVNHPVRRWELSEHLVPSRISPVYRNFSL